MDATEDAASRRSSAPPAAQSLFRQALLHFAAVPLYLTEADVASLLDPADAVEAIEECFRRMARGAVVNAPRRRLRLPEGALADMAAADHELGLAGGEL